jgi:DNA-binding MarR family transcriptional regulator
MPPASSDATEPDRLAGELRLAVMRLARRLRRERADSSLTLSQLAALSTLEIHGEMTLRELADHERVRPPSMTKIVSALEELELVRRTPDPADGRQVLVSLTAAAHALLAQDRRRRDLWLAQRLRELTAEERDVLQAALPLIDRVRAL